MANAIDSLNYGDNVYVFTLPYGTCSTTAATAAKVVSTASADNFSLETGASVRIKFTYANTASAPTLNVNSTGAKNIYWHGVALTSTQYWQGGAVLDFVYNGAQWDLIGVAKDNNTTYSAAGSSLGLVKSGGNVTISNGTITVTNNGHNHVISNIDNLQDALDAKLDIPELESEFVLITDSDGNIAIAQDVDVTTLNYISTLSSNAQTQLNSKMNATNPTCSGTISRNNGSATGSYSACFGYGGSATGAYSINMGRTAYAQGTDSFAQGYNTSASGGYSQALGRKTTALANQMVIGHDNSSTNNTAGSTTGTTGTAFVIGNGTDTSFSNAMRVTYEGQIYANDSITSSGRDYAEYFEWEDSNLDSEDRRGYFVTLEGDKIRIANPGDYILGVISGQPSVIGNGDEDWKGRYILDDFECIIKEEYEYEEEEAIDIINEETGETKLEIKTAKKVGTKYKENPDYDATLTYIQRKDRPEWDAVGMLGVLSVRDDGTCKINGFCKVAEGGIATAANEGYRVIKRINDHIIKVVIK